MEDLGQEAGFWNFLFAPVEMILLGYCDIYHIANYFPQLCFLFYFSFMFSRYECRQIPSLYIIMPLKSQMLKPK